MMGRMTQSTDLEGLARAFGEAVAAKDADGVRALLHPDLDFREMTPGKVWEAAGPEDVLFALGQWFEDSDVIEDLEQIDTDSFADRARVGYRLRVSNPDGRHLVEQQAFVGERDGRIGWLRIMCAGYRPLSTH
jgi:hypothetical protein